MERVAIGSSTMGGAVTTGFSATGAGGAGGGGASGVVGGGGGSGRATGLRFLRPLGETHDCREETVSGGWGEVRCGQREWEDFYRRRWQYDKRVRSTHGVHSTGSCSWDVYVKNGIIVWETQRTDYPGCGAGFPNHEPRGCPRGATYSWYTYSPVRLKHPLMRSSLLALWREALAAQPDPVAAWRSIATDEPGESVMTRPSSIRS